jgi:two-component system nitrogen regulation response regulator NtrX
MARILIVDDEVNIIRVLSDILQDEDHIVYSAGTGQEAISFVSKNKVDLVFLDLWLPDIDGLEVLDRIRKQTEEVPVVMISGHGSIDIAVKSTKQGAYDFLENPLSMERIITVTGNALESYRLRRENRKLRRDAGFDDEMIGMSPAISEVKAVIAKAASTNARVFITGENGTGKELVARAIYARSARSDKPLFRSTARRFRTS